MGTAKLKRIGVNNIIVVQSPLSFFLLFFYFEGVSAFGPLEIAIYRWIILRVVETLPSARDVY